MNKLTARLKSGNLRSVPMRWRDRCVFRSVEGDVLKPTVPVLRCTFGPGHLGECSFMDSVPSLDSIQSGPA